MDLNHPGYVRAVVRSGEESTKVEWAHDSSWRFLPTLRHERVGYVLHPIDLTVNKVLALAGRDEPRDLLDVVHQHRHVLPLGALDSAERFVNARPPDEIGCLYYSRSRRSFVGPADVDDAVPHYGRPGGMLPRIRDDG